MGRSAATSRSAQVNVRLTALDDEDLEVLAFLAGTTVTELVRGLIERELERARQDVVFQRAKDVRAEYRHRAAGVVVPLHGATRSQS
jgi:hypothetical protein